MLQTSLFLAKTSLNNCLLVSRAFDSIIVKSKNLSSLVSWNQSFCLFLNDDVILLCIYSNGHLQPRELQLGAQTAYSVESLSLLYQFLLFVIYCSLWLFIDLLNIRPRNRSKVVVLLWFSFY